jgi:acetyl esterase/lipase
MTPKHLHPAILCALCVLCGSSTPTTARDLTPAEKRLIEIFGPDTPRPLLLWPDGPPRAITNPPPEEVTPEGRIKVISTPTISVYLPPKEKATGRAILMFPGGGYGAMDWVTHVVGSAKCLNPEGTAVIGLKYRTCKPYPVDKGIQQIALLDAKRAVRLVKHHAAEWGIDPRKLGVAGYSAGANLAMMLAGHFDAGDPGAADPVERQSSRPAFIVGCATWHWRETKSPFTFRKDTPPIFLVHATNDGLPGPDGRIGGAPIQLPKEIKSQLEALGVPVELAVFDEGGHGVGNLIPARYNHGFPGAQWPRLLMKWLDTLPR